MARKKKATKPSKSVWTPLSGGSSAMTFGKDAPTQFDGALFTVETVSGKFGDQVKLGFLDLVNTKKAKPFYVWAPAGLARQVEDLKKGTQLRVEYEGKVKITSKNHPQKGKKAHSFRVSVNGLVSKSSDYSGYKFNN